MSTIIAITGKGGTGKTTLSGLLIDYLIESGRKPVLAVDADANSNLNEVLGVEVERTLGSLRESIVNAEYAEVNPIPPAMSKQEYLSSYFGSAVVEEDDYDMLVMGRTQGKGCYCFVNGLLQAEIGKYAKNYKYVVVDNEAGMEHISRGVLPAVNIILIISDASRRGIQAAARIRELVDELNMKPETVKLIVNRAPGGEIEPGLLEEIEKHGLDLAGAIPIDERIYEYDRDGVPTIQLPPESKARKAFAGILDAIIV
ncbi:MAG: AAA family ATPase [Clostridiales Family XIII bacterium]|jgi:CO dehydrogenase maturation factor|nr:AAA family ATPase [Clostridiales Family XIII bacterium]